MSILDRVNQGMNNKIIFKLKHTMENVIDLDSDNVIPFDKKLTLSHKWFDGVWY